MTGERSTACGPARAPGPLAIETANLAKRFGSTWALKGLTVTLPAGACLLVLGPNGAGKSTFVALLATLLRPSSGSARIFGRSIIQEPQAVRGSVGVLTHQPMLYPHLSVQENLLLFGELFAVAAPSNRVTEVLDAFALREFAGAPVASLSHGSLQRVALARAFLPQPRLLLLDEPFAGLDEASGSLLRSALLQAHAAGVTVLMTAQEREPVAGLPDTVAVLAGGELRGWAERPAWTEADLRDFYHQSLRPSRAGAHEVGGRAELAEACGAEAGGDSR
jgi:heme exporter protein A